MRSALVLMSGERTDQLKESSPSGGVDDENWVDLGEEASQGKVSKQLG